MAIFTGVASKQQSEAIIRRIARGNCTGLGKRATWVSERPYYHKGQLMSDSTSSEGRVGLMDARARVAIGDDASLEYFDEAIVNPIRDDLLRYTWLSERYDCEGRRTRTKFFFEYPCLIAMLLREERY